MSKRLDESASAGGDGGTTHTTHTYNTLSNNSRIASPRISSLFYLTKETKTKKDTGLGDRKSVV